MLDIVQQALLAADSSTLSLASASLGQRCGVYLPRALQFYRVRDDAIVDLLVAEALGRVWVVSIPYTVTAQGVLKVDTDAIQAPRLLLDDASASSTAAKLQARLMQARESGRAAEVAAFFYEASR